MTEYYAGDVVLCKVDFGKIVASESMDFEAILSFDIVCTCGTGFLVMIKSDVFIRNTFILTKADCIDYKIPDKFTGGEVSVINLEDIVKLKSRMTGYACSNCKEFFSHSNINRFDKDGNGIYICYLCRVNRYR